MVYTSHPLLVPLQTAVEARGRDYGHHLGVWSQAKRKCGPGAIKSLCIYCGQMAILAPQGMTGSSTDPTPAAFGDALFLLCSHASKQLHLLPPAGGTGTI